jgi:hypothetical protein
VPAAMGVALSSALGLLAPLQDDTPKTSKLIPAAQRRIEMANGEESPLSPRNDPCRSPAGCERSEQRSGAAAS